MDSTWVTIKDLILSVLQVVIIGALPVLSKFVSDFLKARKQSLIDASQNDHIDSVIARVFDLVERVVSYVSQTYVESLKKDGKFDKEEQAAAFAKAYERLLTMIDEESKALLEGVFGDLSVYLQTLIEAAVRDGKTLPAA